MRTTARWNMPDPGSRTWTLKLRGDLTGTIAHEYLCPEHGRFTAEVSRADPPDEAACPHLEMQAMGPDDRVVPDGAHRVTVAIGGVVHRSNACGLTSLWSPGGATVRVKAGEVTQGKIETNGLPPEVCMDTRPLADGMPLSEFKARRAKVHADLAINKMRALTGRGGKVMR